MADFATVAELEAFMGTSGLGTRGTTMLGYASSQIRRACGGLLLEPFTGRQEEFAASDDDIVLFLSQRPVTAVTAVTINAVAFTGYEWARWGTLVRNDLGVWDTGPILVTYDGGYATTDDEYKAVKAICLEMAARALGGPQDTFGADIPELRGAPPLLFLTDEERRQLTDFMPVPVG